MSIDSEISEAITGTTNVRQSLLSAADSLEGFDPTGVDVDLVANLLATVSASCRSMADSLAQPTEVLEGCRVALRTD